MAHAATASGISRRTLLIGGGAGAGLILAWRLWPRGEAAGLRAAPGETAFNAYLKIGDDGRVIVAVPQMELGQGAYTALPQILADELGADWRTVAVEPAPVDPFYRNLALADGQAFFSADPRRAEVMTAGSTSVRAFEAPLRQAGAAARVLMMKAAADRWNVDWEEVETANGFAIHGGSRVSFGEIADAAAGFSLPASLPMRAGSENRLVGQPLPRIDIPAKIDGSARFTADVRLPGMVFASVRAGPLGDSRLDRSDRQAADRVAGVLAIFENPRWVAAVATNWWAANRAVEALKPVFETRGGLISSTESEARMAEAMEAGDAARIVALGDTDNAFVGGNGFSAHYSVGPAPNVPMETLTATARVEGGKVEVWAPVQAPRLARRAAARAAGVGEDAVTIYPMPIGGGYGRKLEVDAVEQAVAIALLVKRPVQLTWSRLEEMTQDRYRPPALGRMSARMADGGRIAAWESRIAAPATFTQTMERIRTGASGKAERSDAAAVLGAAPPYAIPAVIVDHVPADPAIPTGLWRSGARSYTTFFVESFIDEIAHRIGPEPLSFRMQMLGDNPRLARVLTTAATLGGWDGGAIGGSMGIACHSAYGSHAALMLEAAVEGGRTIRVQRAICAVDCGRVVNPELVRQQIEGGILYGIAASTGRPIEFEDGLPTVRSLGGLAYPRLAGAPEITVEIIDSEEEPGGVTELSVPLAAPALANAVYAATGQRLRDLPLRLGAG